MLIKDRVKLIIKANRMNASEFADRIGVNKASLSHVMSGRNKPSLDFLVKILNNFPNVNASWLVVGETKDGGFKGVAKESQVNEEDPVKYKTSSKEKELVRDKELEAVILLYTDGTMKKYKS